MIVRRPANFVREQRTFFISRIFRRTKFAKIFVRGELRSLNFSSRRTIVRPANCCSLAGQNVPGERIFRRTVRQFAAEYVRTRANPGELRRTPANAWRTLRELRRSSQECQCRRTVGESARSSREFARVRANPREFAANYSSPSILPTNGLVDPFSRRTLID